MKIGKYAFILNNHFIVRHCTARDGCETPARFYCRPGLRAWSRFFYLEQGEVDFVSHTGKQLKMVSGDILYLPYDIEYVSYWTDSTNGHYYTVEFILEDSDGQNLNLNDDLTLLFHDDGHFRKLFYEMAQTVATGTMGFQLRCQEQFMHLLYLIAMHSRETDTTHLDIQPAIQIIEEDFCKEIDVNALARLCHMSPATFRRKFLAYASVPPITYRNTLRLNKAKELLLTGLYTVSEAAEIVGIPDLTYFSRLYKQQFGQCPSDT